MAFRVSDSSLCNISICSTRGLLASVWRLESKEEKVARFLGKCVDDVMNGWMTGKYGSVREVMRAFAGFYAPTANEMVSDPQDRLEYQNAATCLEGWLEQNPVERFPFVPVAVQWKFGLDEGDELYLDEGREFSFSGIADIAGQDKQTGAYVLVDTKTTGWLTSLWEKQWRLKSQMIGYPWAWSARFGGMPPSCYINAIEFKKLPSSDRKCKTHGVPFNQCAKYHVKYSLLGPFLHTPYLLEMWRRNAVELARKQKWLSERFTSWESIHGCPMEGMFTGGCTMFGACDFLEFCRCGRPVEVIWNYLTPREEREKA